MLDPRRRIPTLLVIVLALSLGQGGATAQDDPTPPPADRQEALPDDLQGVGIDEKLGAQIPLDLEFTDQDGRRLALGDVLNGSRPVILNLMYLGCPMLCGLIGNGLTDALVEMQHSIGDEFRVLSVSFDPTETPAAARAGRQGYLERYDRPGADRGWLWLTGEAPEITALTEAVGFGYRWNEKRQEFAHAAVLIVLSPDGMVSRYLYGVQFDPRTLQLSLVEAADGKTASTLDRVLLFCFLYDADTGRYGPAARNLMKAGGLVTVLTVGGLVLFLRRRERRRTAGTAENRPI